MATRNYCTFLKVGEKEYMEKLLNEGEVFLNRIRYFNKLEHFGDLRGDRYDGAAYITQIRNVLLQSNDEPFAHAKTGQLYHWHREDQGNIYCLYGIETELLDLATLETKPFNLDMQSLNFGDTAIVIFDPGEFIRRVKKAARKRGLICQFSPIIYYNEKEYEGELSPFYKSSKYKLQNEVRFWIPNKLEKNLILQLGNISDIADHLEKSKIIDLGYSPL